MNPQDEQKLRDLLDSAVSDVEPRHGLDAIQSRTKVRPMSTRPWFLSAGAAVVATAATIAALVVLGGDTGTTDRPGPAANPSVTDAAEDTPSPDESDSGEPAPAETGMFPVYYAAETPRGPRLYREFSGGPGDALRSALEAAVGVAPQDPDYFTPWPAGTSIGPVSADKDLITIDLSSADAPSNGKGLDERPAGMSQETAFVAVQQLVYTATAATQSNVPVRFLLNGQETDRLLGFPTSQPVTRAEDTSVLAGVWIIDPGEGASIPSGFEVSGVGNFFEANVVWELRQGDKVVDHGFTMSEEAFRMAPYSFKLEAEPGDYTLVVTDTDPSDGEGFPPFSDTKNITITP